MSEKLNDSLGEKEIRDGAPMAALSYVFFLWLLAFTSKRDNQFAHYHAKQGLVLFVLEVVFFFLSLVPSIGFLFYLTGLIVFPLLSLYGMYSALTGKLCKMGIVTKIALKLVV